MSRRLHVVVSIGVAMTATGCVSGAIADLGRDPARYETRAEVHRRLGEPVASGSTADAHWEEYRYRGKLRDKDGATGAIMMSGMTFGLSEAVLLPMTLVGLPAELAREHHLRFEYDQTGRVSDFEKDPNSMAPVAAVPPRLPPPASGPPPLPE